MKTYNIELAKNHLDFNTTAEELFEKLYAGNVKYKLKTADQKCTVKIPLNADDLNNLSYVLSHFIIQKQELRLIQKFLNEKKYMLTAPERKELLKNIIENLSSNQDVLDKLMQQQRKLHLANAVSEFLSNNDSINIQGFIHFRLKEYKKELEEYVDSKIELYLADKEYAEFINLLKVFVDTRTYNVPLVHVLFQPAGTFTMLDENLQPYPFNDESQYAANKSDKFLTDRANEILAGLLVEILPAKIVLHRSELYCNNELMAILLSVFHKRIDSCSGCNICLQ